MKRFVLLCLLVLSLLAVNVTAPNTASAAYECPWYTTYCWNSPQCDSYCGGVGYGSCIRGCCACLA
ncbi:MAG TPA: hypothetical protein VEL74_15555 [Thermoanaerobaculia bacterium]|nr:hypothetical protein [Thermoanaerobaculia bacterium]